MIKIILSLFSFFSDIINSMVSTKIPIFLISLSFFLISCTSYRQFEKLVEEFEIPHKILPADFNITWQAVLQVMQKYDLELQNQESGTIKTRWMDNTLSFNFADSFGKNDAVKAAKFKVIINVSKGIRNEKEVAKVSVFKRQMVEQDFLQGWKVIRSDGILEKTILYRINRIIALEKKLKKIEDSKKKQVEKSF